MLLFITYKQPKFSLFQKFLLLKCADIFFTLRKVFQEKVNMTYLKNLILHSLKYEGKDHLSC